MGILDDIEVSEEEVQMEQEQLSVEPPTEEEMAAAAAPESPEPEQTASDPEPAPEPEAAEDDEDSPKERMVNYGALTKERTKRRELEVQVARMEERFAAFQERINEQNAPQPEPEKPLPDFNDYPADHLRARTERMEEQIGQLAGVTQQQAEAARMEEAVRTWAGRLQQHEASFNEEHGDYYEAADFLRNSRMAEYKAVGWDDAGAAQKIMQETIQLGVDAERNGMNPAQRFYELAKVRGYQPSNGAAKQAEPAAPDLRKVAENMERTKSLGPSGNTPGKLSLADLANMPDDEFDKATSGDNWSELWQ